MFENKDDGCSFQLIYHYRKLTDWGKRFVPVAGFLFQIDWQQILGGGAAIIMPSKVIRLKYATND